MAALLPVFLLPQPARTIRTMPRIPAADLLYMYMLLLFTMIYFPAM